MGIPRLFKARAKESTKGLVVRVKEISPPDGATVVSSPGESQSTVAKSIIGRSPSELAREARDESIAKCLAAFGDEAQDLSSGEVTAASVLALANAKRTEKAPVEGSKTDRVLRWAVAFAKNVDAYSKVVDVYISKAPEVAGLVWGGCKILLQTGLNHIDVLEKLFAILNRVGENIGRFQQYESLFGESERMKDALALIYTDILELSVGAALFYRRNGFLNYLSSLVKNFDTRFGSNVASFLQHKELLEDEVWAAYLCRVLGQKPDISVKDVRRWLTPPQHEPDYLYSSRSDTSAKRVPGSCVWFKPYLESFLEAEDQTMLTVVGGPGVGKSALAGWILDEVESQREEVNSSTVLQFFIKGNEQHRCSSFDLVRSLLLQLLEKKVGNLAIHQRLAVTLGKSVQNNVTKDSESLLWLDLRAILAASNNFVIVVDGLDELEGGELAAQAIVRHFAEICDCSAGVSKHVKVILTTRPLLMDVIGQKFTIEPHHTVSDIATYVDMKLDEMTATVNSPFHRMEPSDRSHVAAKVKEGARGMILWARLVLEEMTRKKTLPQIQKCLDDAPKELTDLYAKIFEGLDHTNTDTNILFRWLLCSQHTLSLAEIEAILEIDINENIKTKRLTPLSSDIQDACGPLVEVSTQEPRCVRLVHYSARQWMLQSSVMSLQQCHLQAFRTVATYLSLLFGRAPRLLCDDIPLLVPLESQKQRLMELCREHSLLEYSVSYWTAHLSLSEVSFTKATEEVQEAIRLLLTDTENLAIMEAILWSGHGSHSILKAMHQYAFNVRSNFLELQDPEKIQTTANLAMICEHLLDYSRASTLYHQAWVACQSRFGDLEVVTLEFANAYALNLEKQEKGIEVEQIYKWMWQSLQKRLGNDQDETLTVAARLAWMYQRHEKFEEANQTYREIWETWSQKLGHLDEQAILAAGYYARALQLVGQNEGAIAVHLKRLQAANEDLEKIDPRFYAAVVAVAQAYEFASLPNQAESMMKDAIKDMGVIQSPENVTGSMGMCLELARFLERQSKAPEAQAVLGKQLSWCKANLNFNAPIKEEILSLLKDLAQELQKQGLFSEARGLISSLRGYYELFEGTRSGAALDSICWSAQVALEDQDPDEELRLLRNAYDTARDGNLYDEVTLGSARHLALSLHRRSDWKALERLCKEILEVIWPSILTNGPQHLPKQHAKEAVLVARRLALAYQKQDLFVRSRYCYSGKTSTTLTGAEIIYFNIFMSYYESDGPYYRSTLGAAAELGKFYESRCKFEQAESMYKSIYDTSRTSLGPSHPSTLRSVIKLAKFYDRRKEWSKSENLQEDALQQVKRDWGPEYPIALEFEVNLVEVRKNLAKGEPTGSSLKLAKKLKSGYVSGQKLVAETTLDESVLQNLYTEQLEASKDKGLPSEDLSRIQELYHGLAGQLNRTSLKIAMKLGDLLERHRMDTIAIRWYEYFVSIDQDQSASPVLLYEPMRRLAHLYETSAQMEKAEKTYQLNWQNIKSKKGGNPTDESSIRALRDLFRFFQRTDPSRKQCFILIKTAWENMKEEKKQVNAFHKGADALINFCLLLDRTDKALNICREAIAFKPDGMLDVSSLNLVDKTCEKNRQEARVIAERFQLENQVALGLESASTILEVASKMGSSRYSYSKHVEDKESVQLLRKAYEFWKAQDPVGANACGLGDLLAANLKADSLSADRERLRQERWNVCKADLGYLAEATIKAGKALGKGSVMLDIWNAHKEALGSDDSVTLDVGSDIADHCNQSGLQDVAFTIYGDLFNACWSSNDYGPVHDRTLEFGLALASSRRNKDADMVHQKLFDALKGDESLSPQIALTKYTKLAKSCEFQTILNNTAPNDTSKLIILHTLNLSKDLEGYYAPSTIAILDRFESSCKRNPSPKDKESVLTVLEDFYHHRSHPTAWPERQASTIGRTLSRLYFNSGREELALDTISDIISHDEREYGSIDCRATIASYDLKSDLLFERKDYNAALAIHKKILRRFMEGGSSGRVDFMEMLHQFHMKGRALQRLGRWGEARRLYDEAFSMSQRIFGPGGFYVHKLENIKMWSEKAYEGF